MNRKKIVVSAINITEGGTLSILKDCLAYLSGGPSEEYDIISLVHKKDLLNIPDITYYEFPDSKKSWPKRLYYEYLYFNRLSRKIRPYLWLSLHDITPNVTADVRAVYCHNPSFLYKKFHFLWAVFQPVFFLYTWAYKYLYGVNIRKNDYVIVQQNCMRREFERLFSIKNVIIAHPEIKLPLVSPATTKDSGRYDFFYPSFPRVFKNIEVICEAAQDLYDKGMSNFNVILTINGTETRYSRYIYNRYKRNPCIRFVGRQSRENIIEFYKTADCMIFPSKLESWGVPITEFKAFKKPILAADLEYAHETVGDYDKVKFFDPDNAAELSYLMQEFMKNRLAFKAVKAGYIKPPFASNWKELFDILLASKNRAEGSP